MNKQTFTKNERLCSKKIIDRLFEKGSTTTKSLYLFPFKVFYLKNETYENTLPQVLFSISKRNFKRAVDRNQIRRRCREAYRLNKNILADTKPSYIAFVYIGKEIAPYNTIEKGMKGAMEKISKSIIQ